MSLKDQPHKRLNPLTGDWVLVSPHRLKRPWQGKQEEIPPDDRPAYDPKCYLCPGNERAGGAKNPKYTGTYCFTNDFAALLSDAPPLNVDEGLFQARGERGLCRVICFSPQHNLTLPQLDVPAIRSVVDTWTEEYQSLGANDYVNYVQIFENKGQIMGCSNPHPHGQLWATETLPVEPEKEDARFREYFDAKGRTLLTDYIGEELNREERVVVMNDHWAAVVPYWAKWPYETLLVARRPVASMPELKDEERNALAEILKKLTARYDNLFQVSFPYTMGFHQAPTDGQAHPHWHLHGHFYPPLLRSATVQKFMVGFEMLGTPQRDITAEMAAEKLRSLPETPLR